MILNLSKPPYEIGARRFGCRDGNGKWHQDQAFVLVREVTQNDWIAFVRDHADSRKYPTPGQILASKDDRFFEVATD